MKINEGFILRQIADKWVVLAVGQTSVSFHGMLALNESGVLLWNILERGGDRDALTEALLNEYEVTREEASADVDEFVNTLKEIGCIE